MRSEEMLQGKVDHSYAKEKSTYQQNSLEIEHAFRGVSVVALTCVWNYSTVPFIIAFDLASTPVGPDALEVSANGNNEDKDIADYGSTEGIDLDEVDPQGKYEIAQQNTNHYIGHILLLDLLL